MTLRTNGSLLVSIICLLALTIQPARATTTSTYYTLLDGIVTALILTPRDVSQYKATQIAASDRFYSVQVANEPESAGRLAYIGGQWQGMLLRDGNMYALNDITQDRDQLLDVARYGAQTLSADLSLGQCGSAPALSQPLSSPAANNITVSSLNAQAQSLNYNQFCLERVDGICLVAELTVVFDTAFETRFGSDYQASAIAIMEDLDLLYRNNFNIVFNKLNMAFGNGDQFTDSTNAVTLLNDITDQRDKSSTAAFDPNRQSILHVITGREFDGDTIGVAWQPGYINFPIPETPLLCSGQAIGTSQVYTSSSDMVIYTALIVAHEIGHNFGFAHDGVSGEGADSCSATRYIMGEVLSRHMSDFSSCSTDALKGNLSKLSSINACFDYPTDHAISAYSCNPINGEVADEFTNDYTVYTRVRSNQLSAVQVSGSITSASATLLSATLNGNACTLGNSNTSYSCSVTSSAGSHALSLHIKSSVADVSLSHQVTSSTSDQYDVKPANNELTETVTFPRETACVPPRQDQPTPPSLIGGSGGGGSLGWLTLGLLMLLPCRKFRCS